LLIYFDAETDFASLTESLSGLTRNSAGFHGNEVRERLLNRSSFAPANVRRYLFRPFDERWCYYSIEPNFWKRSRPELGKQIDGNRFLLTRAAGVTTPEGFPILYTRTLVARDSMRGHAVAFPFALNHSGPEETAQGVLIDHSTQRETEANLSELASQFLQSVDLEASRENAAALWLHALAIGYSPAYVEENADGIRGDWPRIPLPALREEFLSSAALGTKVANILDTEQALQGVTAGVLRAELRGIAALTRIDGKPLEPGEDFAVTAGWGHAGKEGVTMPGRGKVVRRERSQREQAELVQGIAALGLSAEAAIARLGSGVVDVYLNDRCAWTGIPEKAWELYIGGYQVIKKWLSYREHGILGRALTLAEVEEVQAMARRLTALCLLQPQLDANYEAVKANTWKHATAEEALASQK
jgi:hypothetical protein